MMKTLLAASLLLVACTDNTAPTETGGSEYWAIPAPTEQLPGTKITVRANDASPGAKVYDPQLAIALELSNSPCGCETFSCLENWTVDNIGCEVDVEVVCGVRTTPVYAACHGGYQPRSE